MVYPTQEREIMYHRVSAKWLPWVGLPQITFKTPFFQKEMGSALTTFLKSDISMCSTNQLRDGELVMILITTNQQITNVSLYWQQNCNRGFNSSLDSYYFPFTVTYTNRFTTRLVRFDHMFYSLTHGRHMEWLSFLTTIPPLQLATEEAFYRTSIPTSKCYRSEINH